MTFRESSFSVSLIIKGKFNLIYFFNFWAFQNVPSPTDSVRIAQRFVSDVPSRVRSKIISPLLIHIIYHVLLFRIAENQMFRKFLNPPLHTLAARHYLLLKRVINSHRQLLITAILRTKWTMHKAVAWSPSCVFGCN